MHAFCIYFCLIWALRTGLLKSLPVSLSFLWKLGVIQMGGMQLYLNTACVDFMNILVNWAPWGVRNLLASPFEVMVLGCVSDSKLLLEVYQLSVGLSVCFVVYLASICLYFVIFPINTLLIFRVGNPFFFQEIFIQNVNDRHLDRQVLTIPCWVFWLLFSFSIP